MAKFNVFLAVVALALGVASVSIIPFFTTDKKVLVPIIYMYTYVYIKKVKRAAPKGGLRIYDFYASQRFGPCLI